MSQWQPPGNPYGGEYPAYEPTGRTDGISIAAFVCALTCCAAPVGVGLGIAGIVRTKDGRRRGRWAAVTGVVLGSLLTVAGLAFVVFAVIMGTRTLWEDEARVGDCLDIDFLDDQVKAGCAEPHDGEVIWVGEFDGDLVHRFDRVPLDLFCGELPGLDPTYAEALDSGDYQAEISIDAFDEDNPDPGDLFYCYLERTDGGEIDGSIRSGSGSESA
ncbi:MAG TPA: DUF4190 domain-containing protein [Nocardioides sp.]|nr:DUF4190 domain-containing protein [Nocardioides sp.]